MATSELVDKLVGVVADVWLKRELHATDLHARIVAVLAESGTVTITRKTAETAGICIDQRRRREHGDETPLWDAFNEIKSALASDVGTGGEAL